MARKVQTQIRQEQIAEAALEVVHTYGLRGLSMERVAQRLELVPSALYRHFPGKGAVIDAMLDLIRGKLEELVRNVEAEPAPALERLHTLLRRHLSFVQHFQAIPRLIFSDEITVGNPARKARMYETMSAYLVSVAGLVSQAQAEGTVRPDLSPDTVAVTFLGLFQSAAILMFMSDGGFDAHRHLERAWASFYEGIASRNGKVIPRSHRASKSGVKKP